CARENDGYFDAMDYW
nr:immunoglobulin heavy chain junction region [Mus musculus]